MTGPTGNEVEIKVTSKNNTRPGFEQSRQETKAFAGDFDRLITKALTDGQTAFQSTTRRAEELRTELKSMRADFAQTGDKGFLPGIKKTEQDLKFLETTIRQMEPAVEKAMADLGDKAGRTGGRHAGDEFVRGLPFGIGAGAGALASGVSKIVEKIGPQFAKDALGVGEKAGKALSDGILSTVDAAAQDIPQLFTPQGAIGAGVILALVTTLAPAAGAALGLAVTAGVGAAILGAGIAIEHNNTQLVASFGRLKTKLAAEAVDAGSVLVGPLDEAMSTIDRWLDKEKPKMAGLFGSVAPSISGLTRIGLDFVDRITTGLTHLGQTFSDVFDDPRVQSAMSELANSLNALFNTISHNKEAVKDTFTELVVLVMMAIGVVNVLINAAGLLDKAWRSMAQPVAWLLDKIGASNADATLIDVKQAAEQAAPAVFNVGSSFDDLSKKMSQTKNTAYTLAGALTDRVLGGLMSADLATLHFQESLTHVSEALKAGKNALNIHTAAGQANREAVLAAVQANIAEYDTMIAAGKSAREAAAKYDTNTTALEKQLHAAGLTDRQIRALIGSYKGVPAKVNTTIAIQGLTKAIEDLNETLRLINGLHNKTVTVHVRRVGIGGGGPDTPSARASGGIAGGLTWVGEHGAELVRLPHGSSVYSSAQSAAMATQPSAGRGRDELEVAFAGGGDSMLAALIQRMIRYGQIQLKVNGQPVTAGTP